MGSHPEAEDVDGPLVVRARRGEEDAFSQLLARHEARVLRVLRLLGVPAQDREDVAQDVFVRAFRHLAGYQAGRSFEAWIYRITVNAAHDYRGRRARRAPERPWDSRVEEQPDERAPGPHAELAASEGRRRLEAAMERISERERTVFVLCELEGLDTLAVGRALGITRITVRRHLSRARGHLLALLRLADERGSRGPEEGD